MMKDISIKELHPFLESPFKVIDNQELEQLTESVKDFGIMTPIIVRPVDKGYEIISGHRRCEACRKLGIKKVPAIIKEMTKDEAIIFMVDCNLHRDHLLPSEKAFAYRLKLEAMKRQGYRSDLTSAQVEEKLTSVDKLAEESNDSRAQIQRYIRLTYLEKPLLNLVDERRIALTPAVELSFLSPEEQNNLVSAIESEDCTPSLSQSIRMRKMSAQGVLDMDAIFSILTEEKGNQKEVLRIPTERLKKYFKADISSKQMEDFIVKAVDYYSKYLQRRKDRESR